MITDETRKPVASTVPGPVEPSLAVNAGRLRMPAVVKVVLALAAMAAALMGQKLADDARIAMEAAPPLLSWLLFGVSAALFVAASLPVPKLLAAPSATFRELAAGMRKRRLF